MKVSDFVQKTWSDGVVSLWGNEEVYRVERILSNYMNYVSLSMRGVGGQKDMIGVMVTATYFGYLSEVLSYLFAPGSYLERSLKLLCFESE